MLYLDSSALLKLVWREAETVALERWLGRRRGQLRVTSELGRVEVLRAAGRAGEPALMVGRALVAGVDLVPLDRAVQDLAVDVGGPGLRTLDALHLASALALVPEVTAFVAYDRRLAHAARAAGLTVAAPGQGS